MAFNPTITTPRPYFEAKLKHGAIASVALPTGTISRATYATSTVTLAVLAEYVFGLVTDLQARGVIK